MESFEAGWEVRRTICMKATHVCHLDRNQASQLLCQDPCPKFGVFSGDKLREQTYELHVSRDWPNHKASCAKESLPSIKVPVVVRLEDASDCVWCNQQGVVSRHLLQDDDGKFNKAKMGPGLPAIIFTASQATKNCNNWEALEWLVDFNCPKIISHSVVAPWPTFSQAEFACLHPPIEATLLTHEKINACDDMKALWHQRFVSFILKT